MIHFGMVYSVVRSQGVDTGKMDLSVPFMLGNALEF